MKAATARWKQWLAWAALGVIWGSTWIATDALSESVAPVHAATARFALAALLCVPAILWRRLKLPRGRPLGFALLLSVTMIDLPFVLLLWARPRVSSATVIVLFAAMPLLVASLTPGVPRRAVQAAIVGLGAIALAAGASFSAAQAAGAAVVLIAVLSAGISALLARRELGRVHPLMTTALSLGTAALLLWAAGTAWEPSPPVQWNRAAVLSLAFLALVAGAPAYAAYYWLLQRWEAYQAVTLQWIVPLVAIGEGALLLRSGLSFPTIAGTVITLGTVLVVMRARPEDDDTVSLLAN